MFDGELNGRRVFLTGHTGFKGAWLSSWLLELGAHVTGYALDPPTRPSLFDALGLESHIEHHVADIRDAETLASAVRGARPELVLHLAAQPLVRASYARPHETFETNVMGSANLLEACRATDSIQAVVVVTSDKCYENREWVYAYRENDALGGRDPYSASKGCTELVTASYRDSFFGEGALVASARAGNVVGGGDWSEDRIVPDAVRALLAEKSIEVRNPGAVRPWQHVLEPLSAYLALSSRLLRGQREFASAWNFGPEPRSHVAVRDLVSGVVERWGSGEWIDVSRADALHEAGFLKLDCTRAADELGWHPTMSLGSALDLTVDWYRDCARDASKARDHCSADIARFVAAARDGGEWWAGEDGAAT